MPFTYPENVQIASKTVIVPIVSTANVAQLAADLLISSLSLHRLAIVDPTYFIPVVGARENGESGITTPLELYGRDDSKVVVLQQRSPVLKSQKQQFTDGLLNWLQKSKPAAVLFLSGVDLSNRTDSQMLTPTHHILPSKAPSLEGTALQKLPGLPIPQYFSPVAQRAHEPMPTESTVPFVPGGGLTRRILTSLPSGWNIPTAALLQFVFEGDNRADAHFFGSATAKVVDLDLKQLKEPESWQGLFGAPHDQSLYG